MAPQVKALGPLDTALELESRLPVFAYFLSLCPLSYPFLQTIIKNFMLFNSLQVEGQLQFFSQQLMPHSLAASQACLAAASPAATSSSAHGSADVACRVTVSMLRSYKLPRTVAGLQCSFHSPYNARLSYYWVPAPSSINGL